MRVFMSSCMIVNIYIFFQVTIMNLILSLNKSSCFTAINFFYILVDSSLWLLGFLKIGITHRIVGNNVYSIVLVYDLAIVSYRYIHIINIASHTPSVLSK